MQNLTMPGFLALTVFFAIYGADSVSLFGLFTSVADTFYQRPQFLMRHLVSRLFAGRYRIEELGFNNLPGQGGVLMLGNHISWLD